MPTSVESDSPSSTFCFARASHSCFCCLRFMPSIPTPIDFSFAIPKCGRKYGCDRRRLHLQDLTPTSWQLRSWVWAQEHLWCEKEVEEHSSRETGRSHHLCRPNPRQGQGAHLLLAHTDMAEITRGKGSGHWRLGRNWPQMTLGFVHGLLWRWLSC